MKINGMLPSSLYFGVQPICGSCSNVLFSLTFWRCKCQYAVKVDSVIIIKDWLIERFCMLYVFKCFVHAYVPVWKFASGMAEWGYPKTAKQLLFVQVSNLRVICPSLCNRYIFCSYYWRPCFSGVWFFHLNHILARRMFLVLHCIYLRCYYMLNLDSTIR